MPRADTARTRHQPRTAEGATLVLLHPGEATDAALAGHLTAVLFAAAAPLSLTDVARCLDISVERLDHVCELLEQQPPPGLAVQRHADHLQLTTAPASAAVVERFLGTPPPVRLSRAALEALAVIAYRQPITRGEIDAVRGVNSDSAVATLLARNLAAEVGRRESVGRPMLLALTPECLQYLGLRSLADLPPLPESVRVPVEAQPPARSEAPAAEPQTQPEAEAEAEAAIDPDSESV